VDTDAVIGTAGNTNQAYLTYGENTDLETSPKSETKTHVWEFNIYKFYRNLLVKQDLAGAKFALYADADCTELVKFVGDNNVYQHNANGDVSDFTTDASGKFTLTGLDSGTYYLKEIEAPAGYNMLKEPVKVTIGTEGAVAQDGTPVETVEEAVNFDNEANRIIMVARLGSLFGCDKKMINA
jgi:hypothetical protein